MTDLSKLSDEQLDELMMQKEQEAASPSPQVDLSTLSDDELDEILELKAEEQIGTVESTARNLLQGATLGTSDEAAAFLDAGFRKLTGDEADFNDIYTQERDNIRQRNELARQAQPTMGAVLEIAGGMATTGGIGGLTKNLALGALGGAGYSTEESFQGIATDATIGTLLTAAGHGAIKGGGVLINKAKIKLAKQPLALQQSILKTPKNEHPKSLRLRVAGLVDSMHEKLDIRSQEFRDKANDFIDVDAPQIVFDKIEEAFSKLHKESEVILENNKDVFIDIRGLIGESLERLKQVSNFTDDGPAAESVKKDFFEMLSSGKLQVSGGEVVDPRRVTFQQAQKIKTELDKMLYKNVKPGSLTDKAKMFRNADEVNAVMNDFTNTIREQVASIDKTGKLRELNQRYTQLYTAKEFMPQTAQDFISLLPGMGNSNTAQKARSFYRSIEAADPELAMDIVENLEPGMIQYQLAVAANSGMQEGVNDVFRIRAMGGVSPLLTPFGLSGGTQTVIANKVGRAGIKAFKLPRTIKGMFENQELVVSKISQINPSLAVVIEDALVDRDVDAVKNIMQSALELPGAAEEFEPGLGFEGKLSALEQQQMIQQVKSDRSLPTRQKLQAITQIKSGQIPQLDPPQQPFFKQYQPRPRNADGRKL